MVQVIRFYELSFEERQALMNELAGSGKVLTTFYAPLGSLKCRELIAGTTQEVVILTGTAHVEPSEYGAMVACAENALLTSNGLLLITP